MLMPEYFNDKADRMIALYRQLEDYILDDTARRIILSGDLPPTADRLLWKLEQMGLHRDFILSKLAKITALTEEELQFILQDAVISNFAEEKEAYAEVGISLQNPLENARVREVMDAEYKKSMGELTRLTRSTMESSQSKLLELLDEVELRVASGVQSYNSAVIDVLDRYAGQGVMVSYPTGAKLTLEAAVRLNVVTSMNQTAGQISNAYAIEAEAPYVLISAHSGARTAREGQPECADHFKWQGKVFKIVGSESDYPNLLESTGYNIDVTTGAGKVENPLGLHGYNCRHSHRGFLPGMRNPWRNEKGELIDGDGDVITEDANKDMEKKRAIQRKMERSIRQTKRKMVVKNTEITSSQPSEQLKLKQEYEALNNRLMEQNKAYNEYCANNDLQPDYVRTQLADFDRAKRRKKRD